MMVLFAAASRAEADRLLAGLPALADQPQDRRDLVRGWIAALYPPSADGRVWGQVEPDRLAERFAGLRLMRDPRLPDPVLPDATEVQTAQLLTVYTRAANQPTFGGALRGPLTDLVLRHQAVLAGVAVDVAVQTEAPQPLADALARVAADPGIARTDLQVLARRLPQFSHVLAGWPPTSPVESWPSNGRCLQIPKISKQHTPSSPRR
ncbi:hypothetical protein [Dactylosporangium sp. CA-139066]|uniref:hypothetical protein n=1 Tax=Dactylosporangium sp. CA-139066 TaxID=3239930 RepID=UPI003D90D5AC